MAGRKYYALCDSNCKFETMSKEQILTAITQAVNEGTIGDIDTGFITTIKTINGTPLKFFVGTQSEYGLLTEAERKDLFAIITNDTTRDGILEAIEMLKNRTEMTPVSGTRLVAAGYHHVRASLKTGEYSSDFGLLHWDGSCIVEKLAPSYKLHIEKDGTATIIAAVDVPLYGSTVIPSGTDMTDSFDIHITKIGV